MIINLSKNPFGGRYIFCICKDCFWGELPKLGTLAASGGKELRTKIKDRGDLLLIVSFVLIGLLYFLKIAWACITFKPNPFGL